jgi:hypothetical protein
MAQEIEQGPQQEYHASPEDKGMHYPGVKFFRGETSWRDTKDASMQETINYGNIYEGLYPLS